MSLRLTRRDAIQTGAALVISFAIPRSGRSKPPAEELNAWITIGADEITLYAEVPEMGQGTRTANAMMLADELDADWATIRVEQASTVPSVYKRLSTGGSGGTEATWLPLRRAGAQARQLLLAAAAQNWGVPKPECRTENGRVIHSPSGRHFRYGELAEAASKLPRPALDQVPLKDPKEFRYIGKPAARVDTPSKVDGSAVFGLDVRVPGMLFAVIARCPHFGGSLASVDDSAAKSTPGVKAVFPVPPIGFMREFQRNINVAGGVAVVADSTWAAIQGRKALKLAWNKGPAASENTASLEAQMREKAAGPPTVVMSENGDVTKALAGGTAKVEAVYETCFQSHATMEPMNTTVHVREDGRIEVWTPTQIADLAQREIAALAGAPLENVIVHMMLSGGSFGRRYQWDYLAEAWQVAKEMKVPVQVMRTREDDLQHDFYLQSSYQQLAGVLDGEGNIEAWSHRTVSTPIRAVFDPPEAMSDPKHGAESLESIPYETRNHRFDYVRAVSSVPRAWWRSVSNPFQVFAVECFIDELAHAAGRDPYEYRLQHLRASQDHDKFRAVLQLAAEKSGWGRPLPPGRGRGVACNRFDQTYVAHVAEVSAGADGKVRVHRVVSAVDCGLPVNPDSVRAQIEGGINFALTPALSGTITVKDGSVEQSNFHDYQVLRLADAPEIEVHLIEGKETPQGGVGESGVPAVAPAVANAVFAATGKRLRRLPILKI
jgi:isoquinoline 1-oxidoreductase beta subunit